MIVKVIKRMNTQRGSFAHSIQHVLGKVDAHESEENGDIIWSGVLGPDTAAMEMAATAAENCRTSDAVAHMQICYAAGEQPDSDRLQADIAKLLLTMDMAGHQYVTVRRATPVTHIHIVCNRIGSDGRRAKGHLSHLSRNIGMTMRGRGLAAPAQT